MSRPKGAKTLYCVILPDEIERFNQLLALEQTSVSNLIRRALSTLYETWGPDLPEADGDPFPDRENGNGHEGRDV